MGTETTPSAGSTQVRDRLAELFDAPLRELGVDLEAVEVLTVAKRRVLRIAVDKDDGVTMDDVAEVTRELSRLLDESDAMGGSPYTLEVSSRGVDRPLVLPRHWRRNAGRLVKVKLADGSALTGRVLDADDADDGGVRLEVTGRTRDLAYAQVAKATVQIEFSSSATRADED